MVQEDVNAHEKRSIEEVFEKTKKPPIKVKWVDHNRGDRHNVNVRSRVVAKQINTVKEEGFIRGNAAARDVQRHAYMYATASDVYVELCKASLCVFWNQRREFKAPVHENDFVSSGERAELERVVQRAEEEEEEETREEIRDEEEETRDEDDHGGEGDDLTKETRVPNPRKRDHL